MKVRKQLTVGTHQKAGEKENSSLGKKVKGTTTQCYLLPISPVSVLKDSL